MDRYTTLSDPVLDAEPRVSTGYDTFSPDQQPTIGANDTLERFRESEVARDLGRIEALQQQEQQKEAAPRPATAAEFFQSPEFKEASTEERLAALDRWAAYSTDWVTANNSTYKPADRAQQSEVIRRMRTAIKEGKTWQEATAETVRDVGVSMAASGLGMAATATAAANVYLGETGDLEDLTSLVGEKTVKILDRLGENREVTDQEQVAQLESEGYTRKKKLAGGGYGAAATEIDYVDRREKLDNNIARLKAELDMGQYPEDPDAFVKWLNDSNETILREAAVYNGEPADTYTDQPERRFDGDLELQSLLSAYSKTRNDDVFAQIIQKLTASTTRAQSDQDTANIIAESEGVVGEIRDKGETLDGPLSGPLRALLQADGVSEATIDAMSDPTEQFSNVVSAVLTGGTAKVLGSAATSMGGKAAKVGANIVLDSAVEGATEAFQQYVEDSRGDVLEAAKKGALVGLAFQMTGAIAGGAKRAAGAVVDRISGVNATPAAAPGAQPQEQAAQSAPAVDDQQSTPEAPQESPAPAAAAAQRDADYMAAVERGDMETAQRMVDEAARDAGYDSGPVFHGSTEQFNQFDPSRIGENDHGFYGRGFYFDPDEAAARYFAGKDGIVRRFYLRTGNILPAEKSASIEGRDVPDGFDSVQATNGELLVRDPRQIKSADPVTYDDNGNIIPLSQRFDTNTADIRGNTQPPTQPTNEEEGMQREGQGAQVAPEPTTETAQPATDAGIQLFPTSDLDYHDGKKTPLSSITKIQKSQDGSVYAVSYTREDGSAFVGFTNDPSVEFHPAFEARSEPTNNAAATATPSEPVVEQRSAPRLYHGSPQPRDEIKAGSMLTDKADLAAGYTTKVDYNDLSETFTGKVHAVEFQPNNPINVTGWSVAKAAEYLVSRTRGEGTLQRAAAKLRADTGADAIVVTSPDGNTVGMIPLIDIGVVEQLDPTEVLRAQDFDALPENMQRALRAARSGPQQSTGSAGQSSALASRAGGSGIRDPQQQPQQQDSYAGGPGASSTREWRTRNAYRRFATDERLGPEAREAMGDPDAAVNPSAKYVPITNKDTAEIARKKIDENGVVATAQAFIDNRLPDGTAIEEELTGAQRVTVGQQLLLKLNEEIKAAKKKGLTEDVEGLADLSLDVADATATLGTEAGQQVQAFRMWGYLTPEGVLRKVQQLQKQKTRKVAGETINQQTGKRTGELQAEVEAEIEAADKEAELTEEEESKEAANLIKKFAKIHSDTLEWVQKEMPETLTRLFNEHIKSPIKDFNERAQELGATAGQAGILDTIAGAERNRRKTYNYVKAQQRLAEMPQRAAESVVQKFAEAFSDTPTWRDKTTRETVTSLINSYIREPFGDLVSRLVNMGVREETATQVRQLADEQRRRIDAAKKAAEIERNQVTSENSAQGIIKRFAEAFSDTPTWTNRETVVNVASVVRDYIKEPFDDFQQRLMDLGVKPETAPAVQQLADEQRRRQQAAVNERARQARERRINKLLDDLRPKNPKKANPNLNDKIARQRFMRAIERARELGVLNEQSFQDAYADAFGYRLTPKIVERLTTLAEDAMNAPEGFIKQDKAQRLAAEVAFVEGLTVADVGVAMWYANILSGLNTQGVNIAGSGMHLLLRMASAAAADPRSAMAMLQGFVRGVPRGLADAASTFISGRESVKMVEKYGKPGALELLSKLEPDQVAELPKIIQATKPLAEALKFVFRALQAGDMFWYRTATDARAHLAMTRLSRRGEIGTESGQIARNLADELYGTKEQQKEALTQARQEVEAAYGKRAPERDIHRRAYEIMERQRPEQVREEAHQWATLSTYTQQPDGMLGTIASAMNRLNEGVVLKTRFGDIPVLRPLIPFVNIVANVGNSALDFTPVGAIRGVKGSHIVNPKRQFTDIERKEAIISSMVGATAATIVGGIAANFLEDDDPDFAIYAEGPDSLSKRRQMMSEGWRPYTIKIGDTYIRYNETPLLIPFAILGAIHDAQRFSSSFAQKNLPEQLGIMAGYAFAAYGDAGFLVSVADTMDMLQGKKPVSDAFARTGKGFIPFQGLLRDVITRTSDPTIIDQSEGMWAKFIKDVPFVQRLGTRPMLNAFGEPIERPIGERIPVWSRFVSTREAGPEWRWLAENNLAIPGMSDRVTVSLQNAKTYQKVQLERLKDEREKNIGRWARDIMTDAEAYEYQERVGKESKRVVQEVMRRFPNPEGVDRQRAQELIDNNVDEVRRKVKMQMLGL